MGVGVGVRKVYIKSINRKMMSGQVVSGSCGMKRSRKKRNRYAKISLKAKLIFFRKVIHENGNLRDVPLANPDSATLRHQILHSQDPHPQLPIHPLRTEYPPCQRPLRAVRQKVSSPSKMFLSRDRGSLFYFRVMLEGRRALAGWLASPTED